jgi:periplasmic protein TonB
MACLRESDLQGYLEECGPTPLRQTVESHLVSCARCRVAFDRVVATHQRVNAWLSELSSPAEQESFDTSGALAQMMSRIQDSHPADHLSRLLAPAAAEIPWYVSLYRNLHDLIRAEKLPPLVLTSTPVAVKSIWGQYERDKNSNWYSLAIHASVAVLLLTVLSAHDAIEKKIREEVHMIDPSIKPYEPPKKQTAQGGGGGGAKAPTPVTKGQLPKRTLKQFVPPQVVMNEHPKLAVVPSLIDVPVPKVDINQYGDPLAHLGLPSNGPGTGLGMGAGSGGGVGNGKGGGYGPGEGGGVGGGVYRVGGGVSAPSVLYKVDPEYSEEARKAKYSGTVLISLIVDTQGKAQSIKVVRSLGLGLDEKAMEAVAKWKFKPGMKDGHPVAVLATIEVNFRLL